MYQYHSLVIYIPGGDFHSIEWVVPENTIISTVRVQLVGVHTLTLRHLQILQGNQSSYRTNRSEATKVMLADPFAGDPPVSIPQYNSPVSILPCPVLRYPCYVLFYPILSLSLSYLCPCPCPCPCSSMYMPISSFVYNFLTHPTPC